MNVLVVGLGYVGLPVVVACSKNQLNVQGVDVDHSILETLNQGVSHIDGISDSEIMDVLTKGFRAAHSSEHKEPFDVAVICVPTPLDEQGVPDLTAIKSAGKFLAPRLRKGNLVVLESTSYPGTTEEVLLPILEESGLRAGRDFYLSFSPERIDPGNKEFTFSNTPKIVAGLDEGSLSASSEFYSKITETVVKSTGIREAETAKLLENTFRHINIALLNEMAKFCHDLGIDIWEVVRLAKSKPFGFMSFKPSAGVGGHCIPIDPNFLSFRVRSELGYPFRLVELAEEINHGMPSYVVDRISESLNSRSLAVNGSRILLLGVTYKANISDLRESPSFAIAKKLLQMGSCLSFADPFVDEWNVNGSFVEKITLSESTLSSFDLVVLIQAHDDFDLEFVANQSRHLIDTTGKVVSAHVEKL